MADGLDLPAGVTFLVGENGSGKSTLVEAIAGAYGLSPEGGSSHGIHQTRATESPLHRDLLIQRGIGTGRWGFFLRAETMHGWYTYMDEHGGGNDADYHAMSHGESFLEVLTRKFDSPSFYCLDEPEAALSFSSTLSLIRVLRCRAGRWTGAVRDPLPRPGVDARRARPRGRRVGTARDCLGRPRARPALAGVPGRPDAVPAAHPRRGLTTPGARQELAPDQPSGAA
jgi:hypothetical protein